MSKVNARVLYAIYEVRLCSYTEAIISKSLVSQVNRTHFC